jgi:hypothetical protein
MIPRVSTLRANARRAQAAATRAAARLECAWDRGSAGGGRLVLPTRCRGRDPGARNATHTRRLATGALKMGRDADANHNQYNETTAPAGR